MHIAISFYWNCLLGSVLWRWRDVTYKYFSGKCQCHAFYQFIQNTSHTHSYKMLYEKIEWQKHSMTLIFVSFLSIYLLSSLLSECSHSAAIGKWYLFVVFISSHVMFYSVLYNFYFAFLQSHPFTYKITTENLRCQWKRLTVNGKAKYSINWY